jgi:uncharacterized protein (TIGR02300 family)
MAQGAWQCAPWFPAALPPCGRPSIFCGNTTLMAKPELGVKRTCVACGAKFYDLGKQPAVCPKCGTEQPAEQPRTRRVPLPPEEKIKKRPPVADADTDDAEVEDVDADADETLEDAEELDDAEDDIEVEVEVDRDEEG